MSPQCQFWWNWWVSLAVAVGTLLVVVVALFGNFWPKFFPPVLKLTIRAKEGEKTTLTDLNGRHLDDARYYYILVSNARRWTPAEQTQVFLTRIEEPEPNGDLHVKWTGEIPIRWRNQEFVPLLRTIGPDSDCDFCRVEKKGVLSLLPLVAANNLPTTWTKACIFVATLQARSNVADSEMFRVLVSWDGGWDDGIEEMKQHFVIKPAFVIQSHPSLLNADPEIGATPVPRQIL